MADRRLQVVAETRAFADEIDALLSVEEREAVIAGIALDPEGGDVIPESGGLRKRRVPLPGRGKRGGARIITLYLALTCRSTRYSCLPRMNVPILARRNGEGSRGWSRTSRRKPTGGRDDEEGSV